MRKTPSDRFSDKEQAVVTLAVEGLSNKEIANKLGCGKATVMFHLARVYGRLGLWGSGSRLMLTSKFLRGELKHFFNGLNPKRRGKR